MAAKSHETVSSVLRLAAAAGATVQVQGAGTNVVGCLDGAPDVLLRVAMDRIVDFDATSQVVTAEAGVTGGRLEGFLNERGFTLGHYPQSLDHSTVEAGSRPGPPARHRHGSAASSGRCAA